MPAPWWIALPVLVALAAIALAARRGRRVTPVPLADAATLQAEARRTAGVRAAILVAIGVALAAAFVTAPRPTGELSALVSSGRPTVVVLDMSQSVSDLVYSEIARTLEGIVTAAGDRGRLGLVLFSDDAQ
jgi:regulator of protease activity HflC (stomatin/prohibitin superfamily)